MRFWETVDTLVETAPDFISVTYGAGGHNRETAHAVVAKLVREVPVRPLAHLTCVGASRAETTAVIDQYLSSGVRSFLALRGDPPVGGSGHHPTELSSSVELIALLRDRENSRCGKSASDGLRGVIRPLIIAVAAFPSGNPAAGTTPVQEAERLLLKQAAGASFAITQLFYDPDVYERFIRLTRDMGVRIPILPGVLPPTNPRRLRRVAELSGIEPDSDLLAKLEGTTESQAETIGVAAGAALVERVLEMGAPGVHMYTFNQAEPNLQILEKAGLITRPAQPTHKKD